MPREHNIMVDPDGPVVQNARSRVPIKTKEKNEVQLKEMKTQGAITPLRELTVKVISLPYPQEAKFFLQICFSSNDLNKVIVRACYKVPTLDEITQRLAIYLKLDVKSGSEASNSPMKVS